MCAREFSRVGTKSLRFLALFEEIARTLEWLESLRREARGRAGMEELLSLS